MNNKHDERWNALLHITPSMMVFIVVSKYPAMINESLDLLTVVSYYGALIWLFLFVIANRGRDGFICKSIIGNFYDDYDDDYDDD